MPEPLPAQSPPQACDVSPPVRLGPGGAYQLGHLELCAGCDTPPPVQSIALDTPALYGVGSPSRYRRILNHWRWRAIYPPVDVEKKRGLEPGADRMMPAAVPVDSVRTASSASGSQNYAHVVCLGAASPWQADPHLGSPEPEIDLDAAAETLLSARDVEEAASPTVATGSPFGI
jgi:hypothetical protein